MAKTTLTPKDKQIEDAAAFLLDWIRGIDPTYATAIDAAKDEHGWTPRQCIGAWVAYVLENDLYMQVPTHPFFEPGFTGTGGQTVTCDVCRQPFAVIYPGQHFCSNDCALSAAIAKEAEPARPTLAPVLDGEGV